MKCNAKAQIEVWHEKELPNRERRGGGEQANRQGLCKYDR